MKKYLLMILAALAITTSACNKEDKKPARESSWTINGTKRYVQFEIWQVTGTEGQFILQDKDGNTLRLTFTDKPPASGTYTLVPFNSTLTGAQFKLETIGSFGDLVYKGESVTINMTTDADGTQINIPEINLKSNTATDSNAKFKATLNL